MRPFHTTPPEEWCKMFSKLRSQVGVALPAVLLLTAVGCSTLGARKNESCGDYGACGATSTSIMATPGQFPTPPDPMAPAPVPPLDIEDTVVPPPPVGEAAQPNPIQRMRGATTAFFLNANESVRGAFRR